MRTPGGLSKAKFLIFMKHYLELDSSLMVLRPSARPRRAPRGLKDRCYGRMLARLAMDPANWMPDPRYHELRGTAEQINGLLAALAQFHGEAVPEPRRLFSMHPVTYAADKEALRAAGYEFEVIEDVDGFVRGIDQRINEALGGADVAGAAR